MMAALRVAAFLLLTNAATAACSSAKDCSLGGVCESGACKCDAAFRGPTCSELNLRPSVRAPLLDIGNDTASWGGFPVYDDSDQLWHLFYAEFLNNCPLSSWQTNSIVAHAVSASPAGPYTKKKGVVVQPAFHHNPTVAYDPTRKIFALLSIGNGSATPIKCTPAGDIGSAGVPDQSQARVDDAPCAGIITLSTSQSANGPWTLHPGEILAPMPGSCSSNGKCSPWDAFVTNPSVYIFPNGTALMAYRGGWNPWHIGIAVAPSIFGPFVRVGNGLPAFDAVNEDPGLFRDERGGFHMLTHYFGANGPNGHAFSEDGLSWTFAGQAVNFTIEYEDGSSVTVKRRERPQVLSIGGKPALLFTGVQGAAPNSFTHVQEIEIG